MIWLFSLVCIKIKADLGGQSCLSMPLLIYRSSCSFSDLMCFSSTPFCLQFLMRSWFVKIFAHLHFIALPPPPPPDFSPAFSNVVRILNCDVMMHILRTILQRAVELETHLWTEAMIQMVCLSLVFSLLLFLSWPW